MEKGWQAPPSLPPEAGCQTRQPASRGSMRLHDKLFHRIQVRLCHFVEKVAIVEVFAAGWKAPLIGARSNNGRFAVVGVVAVRHQAPVGGFSWSAVGERPEVDTENRVVAVGCLGVVQHAQLSVVVVTLLYDARFNEAFVGIENG